MASQRLKTASWNGAKSKRASRECDLGCVGNGALYSGGGPDIRWARNLDTGPRISVHLEDGEKIVIVEGRAERTSSRLLVDEVREGRDALQVLRPA